MHKLIIRSGILSGNMAQKISVEQIAGKTIYQIKGGFQANFSVIRN